MTQRAWIAALLVAALAAVIVLALRPGAEDGVAASRTAAAQSPARVCTNHPAAALRALKQGSQQLVVVVHAFNPPQGADSSLVAWLDAGGKKTEVARFAVHPLRAFTSQEPKRTQRFAVSLASVAQLVDESKPLCIEVGFDDAGRAAHVGTAEVDVEIANKP